MVSAPIVNQSGSSVGTYEFDGEELAPKINKQLLHDAVVMYEANKRVGTVRTKSRGMVAGSTRKLFRQKGTGRARAGASRTPVRRGGGHAFGKKPRDFTYRMPRKAVRLATRMALLSKFQDGQARVLEALSLSEIKTKPVVEMLKALELGGVSCLLVIAEHDTVIWRSARNIQGLQVCRAADLNTYDLLHQRELLITKDAIDAVRERVKSGSAVASV